MWRRKNNAENTADGQLPRSKNEHSKQARRQAFSDLMQLQMQLGREISCVILC